MHKTTCTKKTTTLSFDLEGHFKVTKQRQLPNTVDRETDKIRAYTA